MTASWEALFKPKVIDKAEKLLEKNDNLFESFDVENNQEGETLVFHIKDRQMCTVKIKLAYNPSNYQMTCNCKDGDKGKRCHHMAIALLAWDILQAESASDENDDMALAMSVAQTASEESLRLFLSRLFVGSPELMALFQEEFPQEAATGAELTIPARKIDGIVAAYLNQDGLITSNYMMRLRKELGEYLYETNAAFLSQGNWESPWEAELYALQRINDLHEDGRAGNNSYIINDYLVAMVLDDCDDLLDIADAALKRFAFERMTELFETTAFQPAFLESVLAFYLDQFDEPEFQQQQLPVLKKQYKIARENFMHNRDEMLLGLWVVALLNVLTDLDMAEKATKLYEKHQNLFLVRLWRLEALVFNGQIEDMHQEFIQLKAAFQDDPSAMTHLETFQREMADLLENFEQRKFEEKQREFIGKWQQAGDAMHYAKMKKELTQEQWLEFRGDYLALMTGRPELFASLKADKDSAALLAELQKQNDFTFWREYRDQFAPEHAAVLLDVYEAEVKLQLKSAISGRPQYKRAAQIITEMTGFDDGTPRAAALIKELIALYPQRPAMIDELEQISKLL